MVGMSRPPSTILRRTRTRRPRRYRTRTRTPTLRRRRRRRRRKPPSQIQNRRTSKPNPIRPNSNALGIKHIYRRRGTMANSEGPPADDDERGADLSERYAAGGYKLCGCWGRRRRRGRREIGEGGGGEADAVGAEADGLRIEHVCCWGRTRADGEGARADYDQR